MINKKDVKKETVKSTSKQMPNENLNKKSSEQKSPTPKKDEVPKTNKGRGCC
ncbi:MAG: hypothetical protein H7281_06695 [Bacteriovorax sp.]|nr:hypothetical protein [Bacteriovorax sp.]